LTLAGIERTNLGDKDKGVMRILEALSEIIFSFTFWG